MQLRARCPHRWTVRELDLGRTVVELAMDPFRIHGFERDPPPLLSVEVYDGGGWCGSHCVWRVAGKLWAVVGAGEG